MQKCCQAARSVSCTICCGSAQLKTLQATTKWRGMAKRAFKVLSKSTLCVWSVQATVSDVHHWGSCTQRLQCLTVLLYKHWL